MVSPLACPRAIGVLWIGLLLAIWQPPAAASDLYDAVMRNDVVSVEAAIAEGAAVNARQESGRTALHLAARSGYSEVGALLLVNGAKVDARNSARLTPLHMAAIWGYRDVAELLIENCANVDAVSVDRSTPLHLAVAGGHRDVAELLLANDASVNAQRRGRVTPLRVALNYRHEEVVALLRSRAGLVDAARVGLVEGLLPEVAAVSPETAFESDDTPGGARRGSVEHVQQLLTDLGYAPGPVDGRTGEQTMGSIVSFQSEIRQVPTGGISECLVSRLEAAARRAREAARNEVEPSGENTR